MGVTTGAAVRRPACAILNSASPRTTHATHVPHFGADHGEVGGNETGHSNVERHHDSPFACEATNDDQSGGLPMVYVG